MYMTTRMIRSVRSTARFHSITIATSVPTNGSTTPARLAVRSIRVTQTRVSHVQSRISCTIARSDNRKTYTLGTILWPEHQPAWERHRRQAIDGLADEAPGLELAQQALELDALVLGQAGSP